MRVIQEASYYPVMFSNNRLGWKWLSVTTDLVIISAVLLVEFYFIDWGVCSIPFYNQALLARGLLKHTVELDGARPPPKRISKKISRIISSQSHNLH